MKNNFIQNLQKENAELKEKLAKVNAELFNFYSFLHSDKFIGTESDGSRKDWIATGDVINIIRGISNQINN